MQPSPLFGENQQGIILRREFTAIKIGAETYTSETMQVIGILNLRVKYEDQLNKLVLVVIAGNGPRLFGRNWLNHINLNWKMFLVCTV